MKTLINSIIGILGIFMLGSCTSTGTLTKGSASYGYYDNMYYQGYPYYYGAYDRNPYFYPRNRIIHNNIIVVPEKNRVENRDNVRRREAVSPNSRRTVSPSESVRSRSESSRIINRREGAPSRETITAPSSRRSDSPASRSGNSRRN